MAKKEKRQIERSTEIATGKAPLLTLPSLPFIQGLQASVTSWAEFSKPEEEVGAQPRLALGAFF